MDGSSGEGTISPSGDLSSPQSLQTSPNPDSSGLPGDSGQILAGGSPKPVTSMAGLPGTGSQVIGGNRSSPVGSPGSAMPPVSVAKSYAASIVSAGALSGCGPKHPLEPLPLGLTAPRPGAPTQVNSYGLHSGRIHTASPPGLTTDATANDCRLIDYRGAKVAAFLVNGEYLLCLPQAFELFLKHLVGGLHTVYTKLKRLDITPIVCNVEQVRILRGLGAIQPGVNRCKLLSCKDFDSLYKDCTTASSRPGRPPKRATMVGLNHSPANHNMLLKKSRLDSDYSSYENGHITADRLDKTHILPNGYSHHAAAQAAAAVAAATAAPPHINPLPFMALNHAAAHHNSMIPATVSLPLTATSHTHSQHGLPSRTSDTTVIKERQSHPTDLMTSSRLREERSDVPETKDRLYGFDSHRMKDPSFLNGYFWLLAGASANGHSPVLNLSQNSSRGGLGAGGGTSNGGGDHSGSDTAYNDGPDDDDNDSEDDDEDDREQDLSDNPDVSSTANTDRLSSQQLPFPNVVGDSGTVSGQGSSSIETLLRNIQGLLKVAADNARQQERQINLEKAELKMEIMRERELRENMEKQLLEEQRTRILFQKRLKKEKRSRRRVQDQLESEMKKRSQYEDALRTSSAETLRLLNESLAQELERERASRPENEHKMQDCPMSV